MFSDYKFTRPDLQKHIDIQKYIKYSEITDSSVIQGGIIWVERN